MDGSIIWLDVAIGHTKIFPIFFTYACTL